MTDSAPKDYVFVSYSRWDRRNSPIIDQVLDALRAAGVRLWLAPDSVPAGADWQGAIEAAQERASAQIALISRRIRRATGMQREITRSSRLGLPFVAVLLDEDIADPDNQLLPDLAIESDPIALYSDFAAAIEQIVDRLPDAVRSSRPKRDHAPAPRSKGYVFISYAQEDTEFVARLRQFMRERGYGYWDYQDSERNYHTQLFLELEEVIRNATATLSILSPDWKRSPWTVKEFLFSIDVETPVFLLMARDMGPTLVTAGIPYIDFKNPDKGFTDLERALRAKGLIE